MEHFPWAFEFVFEGLRFSALGVRLRIREAWGYSVSQGFGDLGSVRGPQLFRAMDLLGEVGLPNGCGVCSVVNLGYPPTFCREAKLSEP